MKKIAIILTCMLACMIFSTGCTNQKDNGDQETNLGNSLEIDDTDIGIDVERKPDTEDNSAIIDLPDGITYSFRDPDHADGIVVTPRG